VTCGWRGRASSASKCCTSSTSTSTRKIRAPLSKAEARRVVGTYIPWCLEPSTGDVNEAFRIEDEARISFWDALIVATAVRGGAARVLSEDLNPGQFISGVTVVNPFVDSAEAPPPQGDKH
jgi:predicted nucleic acid-binding protein